MKRNEKGSVRKMNETQTGEGGGGGEEQSFVSRQQNKIQNGVIGRIC